MEEIQRLVEHLSLSSHAPESQHEVFVTHIYHPHFFYVRPIACKEYMRDIEAHGNNIKEKLQVQMVVVYKSKTSKTNVRGLVTYVNDELEMTKYDLFACDYGFMDKDVGEKDIYECIRKEIKPLAIRCSLSYCYPLGPTWTQDATDTMKLYVGDETAIMLIREETPDGLSVALVNSCPDDIATMLAYAGCSIMCDSNPMVHKLGAPTPSIFHFTFKQLHLGDVLRVRLHSGKELDKFYVAEKQDYKRFLDEKSSQNYFCGQLPGLNFEELSVGKCVAVLETMPGHSRGYERGVIREILKDETVRVLLIDWGLTVDTCAARLKPMSEKFFYHPAVAIYCTLLPPDLNDTRLYKYLYPGYEFSIEVKEVGDGIEEPSKVKILG